MKRHPSLADLARDHHHALVLAQQLKRDAPERLTAALPEDDEALAAFVRERFASELDPHFEIEERVWLPRCDAEGGDLAAQAATVREHHAALRAAVAELGSASDLRDRLDAFARLLEEHVRFEDRTWFPAIERVLAAWSGMPTLHVTAPEPIVRLSPDELAALRDATVSHYDERAAQFWEGTKDHDVSQNVDALLRHLGDGSHDILDLGCGPGRDLATFAARGHRPIGLEAARAFVTMARAYAGVEVWHQDLLELDLPAARFDGIFANAVLFHVPSQELTRVLADLHATLREGGTLFCSNPRGPDVEQQNGLRWGCYLTLETWRRYLVATGFIELEHYYRPPGRPRAEQPWLATVWRKG